MESENLTQLYAFGGTLDTALRLAIDEVNSMPAGEHKVLALRGIATLLMDASEAYIAEVFRVCPGLESAEIFPDTHLTAEEQSIATGLTLPELQAIDNALMAGAVTNWRKVARVVGEALVTLQDRRQDVPLGTYIQRLQTLVENGQLEVQGNVQFMRHSEVRLPTKSPNTA